MEHLSFFDLSPVTYFPLGNNLVPAVAGKPEFAVGAVPASHTCLSSWELMARECFLWSPAPHHSTHGGTWRQVVTHFELPRGLWKCAESWKLRADEFCGVGPCDFKLLGNETVLTFGVGYAVST